MRSSSIMYFAAEGRQNLPQVLRIVRRAIKKRAELASLKIVVFTALGEGPVLAYNLLHEFDPTIIAVTFPLDFSVKQREGRFYPKIPPKLQAFFDGVGIRVVTGRLPFDAIDGFQGHNDQMNLVKAALDTFGGGFSLSVQAVLAACDRGLIKAGEEVFSITGDSAAIITASTTAKFLSKSEGLSINEILCKSRNLTLARARSEQANGSPSIAGPAQKVPLSVPLLQPARSPKRS